jgi:hypothetical protein
MAERAHAATISQTRSVTLYEPVGAVWDIEHTPVFIDRLKLAKNTGFNAVWLVVLWNELDPVPNASGEIPLIDCSLSANESQYQCALERALQAIHQEGMDVFISLNYASAAASNEFKYAAQHETLAFGQGPAKLYRYGRHIARLVTRNGLSQSARFLMHDEGILGPYASLHAYPDVQQSFRDYLYGLNPSLTYWNSRWGLTGTQALSNWSQVKTFDLKSAPIDHPQLQDHIAWVNWVFRQTFGSGAFESNIRQIIPEATVGLHATYFALINPSAPASSAPQTPISSLSTLNFVSFPYYDSGTNNFGLSFQQYVDNAGVFFQNRQLLVGELGSIDCQTPGDCVEADDQPYKISLRVKRRQAIFLTQAPTLLAAESIGYNIWNLNEFPFENREGSFGVYQATPGNSNTANNPVFKPAACALRTVQGSTSPTLCIASGGVNNQYSPRALWLSGRGFQAGAQIRLSNEAGTYVYPALISPIVGSSTSLSFQLDDATIAQLGCGTNSTNCAIVAEASHPQSGTWSNKVLIQVN